MKKTFLFKSSALSFAAIAVLGMSGCNSSSSDEATDTEVPVEQTQDSVNKFAGPLSLSGEVDVANVAKSPARVTRIKRAETFSSNEIVELYVLNAQGEMEDTNISCPVDATTHEYKCNGIVGNQDYIVRYMKDLGDGRVYEMKTNVTVVNEDVTDQKVNKITSVIADAISKAVEDALSSVSDMEEETIKTLMVSIKKSVEESVVSLIDKGIIQIPDDSAMIVQLDEGKTFDDFKASAQNNENLQKVSDVVISDKSVVKVLDSSKNEAKLQSYADMSKAQIISEIFKQFGDDDIPGWIIDFLADKYETQLDIANIIKETAFEARDIDNDPWLLEDFKRVGIDLTEQELAGILVDIVTQLNNSVQNGDLLNAFKAAGEEYLAAKKANNVDILAEFPPILGFLFENGLPTQKFENAGQAVVFALYADDVYATEFVKKYLIDHYNLENSIVEGLAQMDLIEFNPEYILRQMGLNNTTIAAYNYPEIKDIDIKTDTFWDNEKNQEKEIMTLHADMSKALWLVSDTIFSKDKLTKVTLQYPTSNGMVTREFNLEKIGFRDNGDGFAIEYSPWAQEDGTEDASVADITDNISGDYTLSVIYDGETFTKTANKFVLKDLQSYYPELVSPLAAPKYPSILENIDWAEQLTPEQEAAQKEFDEAQRKYMEDTNGNGFTTFAPNENGILQDLVISWDDSKIQEKIATLDLPGNIIPAYEVGISLYNADLDGDGEVSDEEQDQCNKEWDKCNTEIFNTWWDNRPLTTTSLLVPIDLQENVGEGMYQVHTDLIFIDKNTGSEVAHGGHSDAQFKIAEVADLTGDEVINFSGTLTTDSNDTVLPLNIKVAFVETQCSFDKETFEQTCKDNVTKVAEVDGNGMYTLSINTKELKDSFLSNQGVDLNLVAFDDSNNNGQWDRNDDTYEQEWYPENRWFNFETWGGLEIGVTTYLNDDYDYESYSLIPDKNISITNIDFQLYGLVNESDQEE